MIRLLFVDDDARAHDTLELVLPPEYELLSATTLAEGKRLAAAGEVDLVHLDLMLPDGSGLELLAHLRSAPLAPPVVMLTGVADVRTAVAAIRAGASDYLLKPYELRTLLATLHTAQVNGAARRSAAKPAAAGADELVGETAALLDVRELMEVYADSDAPVMVTGESGTGKELVARGIHRRSHRAAAPFVAVNCGAIPDTLVESELFGSEEGAFTGAVSRAGCFERAGGGTLFLDEVAEMPPDTQVKLLRALENREVTRVGGRQPVAVNVRVVSATNRDVEAQVADGRLRADLWYRLAVLLIHVPPLRERGDDIPLLAHALLRQLAAPAGRIVAAAGITLSDAAVQALAAHPWPGNVRELRNVLERARLLARRRSGDGSPVQIEAGDIVLGGPPRAAAAAQR